MFVTDLATNELNREISQLVEHLNMDACQRLGRCDNSHSRALSWLRLQELPQGALLRPAAILSSTRGY